MSLPDWALQISVLLAGAVLLGLLARRVRLQLTVVLALVGLLPKVIAQRAAQVVTAEEKSDG